MTSRTTLSICRELIDQSVKISYAFQKGTMAKDEAVKQVEEISTDYSHGKTEIDSLVNFVRTVFDMGNITISPVTAEIGWSGNSVFWVRNIETTEIKLFLKVFEKNSKNFLPELYGLNYLQRVQGIASPQLQALGKFYIDDRCHFVIAETPTKGHSFQYYYNDVAKHSIGSPERKKTLQTLLEGSRICGTALANLHMHVKGQSVPLPEEIEKAMRADLERAISKLRESPQEAVEINKLIKYVEISIEKMKSELHLTGVTHGDIKLIHAFYHPDNQQISLIGPCQLINSIGRDGNLKGIPVKDYYAFIRSLLLNRFGYSLDIELHPRKQELLTVDEALKVIDAFQKGYNAAGGISLTATEEDFLLLSHNLMFIGNLDRVLPEPDLTRLKDLIALSLGNIRQRLESI
jgi:hypothetical protein